MMSYKRIKMKGKADAETLSQSCANQTAVATKLERRDKSEKPPALYDLTTLQRDANRILGFTAQQTLDYLQSLYEKKLCTYPRTDSRYLTSDMADGLAALVNNAAAAMPKVGGIPIHVNAAQVINDKKVSDHHAVIPTANFKETAITGLPAGERAVLELVALRLLCAVAQSYEYTETAVTLECAGHSFSAKGRTVMNPGWRALMETHYSGKGENESSDAVKALPPMDGGQAFTVHSAAVKEGKTTPPKHYTEDTLLSAMEVAGAKKMPEDFRGHSLSVSDIVALKQNGVVSCHYVDSWGFKELPGFLKPENYLKNAEMAMEDDYGMIDGIINNGPRKTVAELEEQSKTGTPISLLELAQAVQREDAEKRRAQQPVRREKSGEKPSILAKLKTPSVADTKSVKSAPKRSAEREL